MKPKELTLEERALVHDIKDIVYLEVVKGCSLDELQAFDIYRPIDLKQYNAKQVQWMETDKYFLGQQLHHDPTQTEFLDDIEKKHMPERYRALYCLKYPHMVQRMEPYKK